MVSTSWSRHTALGLKFVYTSSVLENSANLEQLAYLYTTNAVDAVAGSSEILLYNVPEIVTSWDFKAFEFSWVKRKACIRDLGQVSSSQVTSDMFIDACLLAGTSLLPTIPPLDNQGASNKPKIKAAMELVMSTGRSGHSVALHYQNDPQCRALNYLDRFRRVRLSIIHHVVLTSRGAVEPFEADHAPSDIHEFIGQRLPEELYFYLSKGIIGPRVLNWRTSGEILEFPPLDNGDSDEYKTLVRDQLKDMRYSTISLLSFSVHRYYLHRDVEIRCWFDKDKPDVISMASLDDPRPTMSKWCVHEDLLASGLNNYYVSSLHLRSQYFILLTRELANVWALGPSCQVTQ
jgi:hypothetical protein